MELTIDKRKRYLNEKYNLGLGFWDLIFWQNCSIQINEKKDFGQQFNTILELEIGKIYNSLRECCKIDFIDNEELNRFFENKVSKLLQQGKEDEANFLRENAFDIKRNIAKEFGEEHTKNFEKVSKLLNDGYSKSFVWLILNEMFCRFYRAEGADNLKVVKRQFQKSLYGFNFFNKEMLDYIYKNGKEGRIFKDLYLQAYKQKCSSNKGLRSCWIKFNSKFNDEANFERNVERLESMVAGTQWCTNYWAEMQLCEGDFYVYVDDACNVRIGIKMKGDEIDEVRGIGNGAYQEIEEEMRGIVLDFLEKNKNFKNGKKWLEKEEWNYRLNKYNKEIVNGCFNLDNLKQFYKDLAKMEFRAGDSNSNVLKLEENLHLLKPVLAKHYDCKEDEIYFGYYDGQEICPYKIIIGDAYFKNVENASKLVKIYGNASFYESKISNLENLEEISGMAIFRKSKIESLEKLKYVGGDVHFGDKIKVNNLEVGGKVFYDNMENFLQR